MYTPLEHDYIGLSDSSSSSPSMERRIPESSNSSNFSKETEMKKKKKNVLNLNLNLNPNPNPNLKATELRLGLPGFGRDLNENDIKIPGVKRGFSDVDVDSSRNWGFNGGSEADLKINSSSSGFFSPINVSNQELNSPSVVMMKLVEEKKKAPVTVTVTGTNENESSPPAAKAQVVGWPPIRSFRKNTMATTSSKNENEDVVKNSGSGGCLYVKVSMDGAPYLRKVDLKTYHNYGELSKALEKLFSCFTLGKCTSNGQKGLDESNIKELLHGSECVLTYEDKDGDWMLVGDVPWEMFIETCKRLRIMKGSEAIGLAPRSVEKSKGVN